jgi:hypothetical protein
MFDGVLQTLDPLKPARVGELCELVGRRLDSQAELDNVLRSMSHTRAEMFGMERLDANETALFGRQLEYISTRLRETKRPELKWRSFVPVTSEVPAGAEQWTYYMWDAAGMADIVANYGDDIKRVAVTAKKYSFDIASWALGYDWSVLDIERAAMAGVNYRNRKSNQVTKGFELRFESMAALGYGGANIKGLLNNANVPVIAAAVVGGSAVWGSSGKSANDVLNDLIAMEDSILTTTKGVETPDSLLLSLPKYRYIQNTPVFTGAGSDPSETILKVFLERSRYVTGVDWWHPLATANASANGPRACMYKRDPEHVHFEMPMAPRELPAQVKNLALEVNSWCRAGGVVFEYPLSAVYMDGL